MVILPTIILINRKVNNLEGEEQKKYKKEVFFRSIIIINILIVLFFRFILPLATKYAEFTIFIWVVLFLNILAIICVFNKKIILNNKAIITFLVIYIIIMLALPIYELDNHEHITDSYEEIKEYTDYYDCYGIRIYRNYK